MKVNIKGRGPIPGLNAIAPAYNQDIDEFAIRRLLNFTNLRVYHVDSGSLITKKNIDTLFTRTTVPNTPVAVPAPVPIPTVKPEDVHVSTLPMTEEMIESVNTVNLVSAEQVVEDVQQTGEELVQESENEGYVDSIVDDPEVEVSSDTNNNHHDPNRQYRHNKKKNRH